MIGVAGTSPAMTRMGKLRLSAIFFSAISKNDDAHKKPGSVFEARLFTFLPSEGAYFAWALSAAMSASLRSVITPILLSR
jgi:hypothetical protein